MKNIYFPFTSPFTLLDASPLLSDMDVYSALVWNTLRESQHTAIYVSISVNESTLCKSPYTHMKYISILASAEKEREPKYFTEF